MFILSVVKEIGKGIVKIICVLDLLNLDFREFWKSRRVFPFLLTIMDYDKKDDKGCYFVKEEYERRL